MKHLPKKLFKRDINEVEIGVSTIKLFTEDEIDEKQIGYRVNTDGNKIEEWIGDKYIVIGNDSCCGDPIITDIKDKKLPVYTMFCDDWTTLELISESFEQYIDILCEIKNVNLEEKESCEKFLDDIKEKVSESSYEYWEELIKIAYEFLTDEEYGDDDIMEDYDDEEDDEDDEENYDEE